MPRTPTTLTDVNSKKKPRIVPFWIALDDEMADYFEKLQDELENIRMRLKISPDVESFVAEELRVREEIEAFKEELRKPENSLKFVFKSIGASQYDKLVSKHQMDEERKEDLRAKGKNPDVMPYDPETFSVALVARSCIEPEGLTEEFVRDSIQGSDNYSSADFMGMYSAALDANTRQRDFALGKEFRPTGGSKKS